MKKIVLSIIALVAIFALVGCGAEKTKQMSQTTKSEAAAPVKAKDDSIKTNVPTVFIHGYGGTINSFGGMIQRLSNEGKTKKEMVITVQADGTLNVDGQLSKKKIILVSRCCSRRTRTMNGTKQNGFILS